MPTVTGRAISFSDIRKQPSGICQYDPKHDMRAKSDEYQGIIYGINKIRSINDVELTNIMHQIKSAIFADSDVRSLNTTMVEGPPDSSSTLSLRASVCYPSIRLLADIIRTYVVHIERESVQQ